MNPLELPAGVLADAEDGAPRCPGCEYNLTGLTTPRCPECGATFSWPQVQPALPRIDFDRARPHRKPAAFFLTWLTVLFTPWRFAGQVTRRVDTLHALAFGAVCFLTTLLSFFFGADLTFFITWTITAAVYLCLQTILLGLLDPTGWRPRRGRVLRGVLRSMWFWVLVGGYTSAMMATEFMYGPPVLFLSDLLEYLHGARFKGPGALLTGRVEIANEHEWLAWAQLWVWSIGVAWCYLTRLRRRHVWAVVATPAAVLIAVAVLMLYAATIEFVAYPVYEYLDSRF